MLLLENEGADLRRASFSETSIPGTIYCLGGRVVGGPRAYQDQFRGFKSHRVHTRKDFFFAQKTMCGKRESVRYEATHDGNRRAVGALNPMRDKE